MPADRLAIERALPHGHVATVLGALRTIGLDLGSGPTGFTHFLVSNRPPSALIRSTGQHRRSSTAIR